MDGSEKQDPIVRHGPVNEAMNAAEVKAWAAMGSSAALATPDEASTDSQTP